MKTFRHVVATLIISITGALVTPMTSAYASPSSPVQSVDYQVLNNASVPSYAASGKIEVLAFFQYANPDDYSLEPKLAAWVKSQNPDVVFKRVPVAFSYPATTRDFASQQRLYHALETLGYSDQMMLKIFQEIHTKNNTLSDFAQQASFVVNKGGIKHEKFWAAYNASTTSARVEQDNRLVNQYGVQSVPTFVVQGQYKTSAAMTQSLDGTLQVLDFLVTKARSERLQTQ